MECVLNKRDDFSKAFDNFNIDKISNYDNAKIQELLKNKKIIRNKLKINATINNSKIFKKIQNEYGTFYNYLKTFTNDKIIYELDKTTNQLSDTLSKDLQKRGMKFVGSTIIYSYLQAVGLIYSHDKECFLYKKN
jgi:DNA-3-methyladenine glycosylase I